jgi:tripeptide aminopeptidase
MAQAPYTSDLAAQLAPDLLARFKRYVRIDTQSRRDSEHMPSTPGQLELARLLVAELQNCGLTDAELDQNGYVMATLPASAGYEDVDSSVPVIGLIAHVDTSPDAQGRGVEPIVHPNYEGGILALPRGQARLDPATMPELAAKRGHDIVTASGETLLGADDKAGVAEIMAAVAHLASHPELPRPTLRIGFTPDEEIGQGGKFFDLERFGAHCAYTLDGSEVGELQDETFSALEAIITIHGVDVHPGLATGKLVSALRLAAAIVSQLPSDRLTPDTSSGREGFIHPYELSGTAAVAQIRTILRDFDEDLLEGHLALLRGVAEAVVAASPAARLEMNVQRQYSNMRAHLDALPEAVEAAEKAIRAEGLEPIRRPIRGGTDGSLLSERGLPTPNLFTGGHEYHSVREWASLQDMAAAAATVVRLARVWAEEESLRAGLAGARVGVTGASGHASRSNA